MKHFLQNIGGFVIIVGLSVVWLTWPNNTPDTTAWLFFRSSLVFHDPVYLARFDSLEGSEFNQETCLATAALFSQQPGVTIYFWCEQEPQQE